jgi:hypothetical protein
MNQIVDIATLAFIVAGITVLVRPTSQGPMLVKNIATGFAGVISAATAFS